MLAIGRALVAGPSLLLLDEPSLGLVAAARRGDLRASSRRINREQGTSILLVEQNAHGALGIASLRLHPGERQGGPRRARRSGSAQDRDVQEFYLGTATAGERASYRDVKHYKRRKRWLS